jgi:DNA-binding MarR family transcriptional regulator
LTLSTIENQQQTDATVEPLLSSRLLVLGNLLRRGAELRYARMFGLSKVEYGVVGMLGRRDPLPVRGLAALLGMDKAQLSRAVSRLVERRLLVRSANPDDGRDALVSLSAAGLATHDQLVARAREINGRLADVLTSAEAEQFERALHALIERAETLLEEERGAGIARDGDAP